MLFKLIMLFGILLVFVLSDVLFGNTLLSANVKSGLLVIVGPLSGAVLAYRIPAIEALWQRILSVFEENPARDATLVKEIERVAHSWHAHGYRGLEKATCTISDSFLRTGVALVADGCEAPEVSKILRRQCRIYFAGRSAEVDMLRVLAKQAQSFGMIGTVIGMIKVLGSIGNPVAMGTGVSMALFSILYGLLLANLIYLPLHKKIKTNLRRDYKSHLLIMEGVNHLANRKCPRSITYRLLSFLEGEENQSGRGSRLVPAVRQHFSAERALVSRAA